MMLASSACLPCKSYALSELGSHQSMALGTVKSVRVVHIERDIHAFDELRIQPDVRIISDTYNPYGPSVEHE